MNKLSNISNFLVVLSFIPWILGSMETPELQPLFGWGSWMIMCVALAIITKSSIWWIFVFGDLLVIITTFISGGRSFDLEANIIPLVCGGVMFFISLSPLKKNYPTICEISGAMALLSGYIPMWLLNIQQDGPASLGMMGAVILGGISYILLITKDIRVNKFSPSNYISVFFMLITFVVMQWRLYLGANIKICLFLFLCLKGMNYNF